MTGEGASDGTGAGASGVVAAASTHGHFDASLLRLDAWNRVQYHANWLRDAGPELAGAALPRQIIRERWRRCVAWSPTGRFLASRRSTSFGDCRRRGDMMSCTVA